MTNEMERRPKNLMAEPPYPDHPDTVMLSMSHPDWTGHLKHVECEIEEPHRIEHCGLWRNTMSEHLSTTEIAADPLERKLERVVNLLATLDMKYTFTSEEHDVCLMAIKDAHDFATEQTRELREEIERLRSALADAIRRPLGVCPDSALGLLDNDDLEAAERRR